MLFPTPKSQRQLFGIEFLGPSEEFNAEKAKFNAERVFPMPKGYFQCRNFISNSLPLGGNGGTPGDAGALIGEHTCTA